MLNHFRFWRERDWTPIASDDYAAAWARFGGSVATHPEIIERLSRLAGITTRYLGVLADGEIVAALPAWGRHLALSSAVLKARGQKRLFDLGNAEIILPVAHATRLTLPALRHSARYLSDLHAAQFTGLKKQREQLALARPLSDFSAKFRYNQRREWRLLAEAGGHLRPVREFSPAELASIYLDLFARRWGFAAAGAERMAEVFALLAEFMTGWVAFLGGAPVAVQVLYRVESPEWISVEYINGGVDPAQNALSPGSVLTWKNLETAWEDAEACGKPLRYSFGRADRDYKERWCALHPVFEV